MGSIKVIGTDFGVPMMCMDGFAVDKFAGRDPRILMPSPPDGEIAPKNQAI